MQTITIRHNVEMAHRLSMQPDSKCFNIHGHSWWVEVELGGDVNPRTGMLLDFADLKKSVREYLDTVYDHHLCLNEDDYLIMLGRLQPGVEGVVTVPCDPTVENMARIWGTEIREMFGLSYIYKVRVWEAATNMATWEG